MNMIVAPFKNRARISSRRRVVDGRAFPSIGDGSIEGALLAWNTLVSAKPIFSDPALRIYASAELGVYFVADAFGRGGRLYADPNAFLVNAATGPARPFIGASGGYEIAISNPVPRQDMTGGNALGTGNAVGGYQKVTNLTTSDDLLAFSVSEPCVTGDEVTAELQVKGTAGQTARFRIFRNGTGTVETTTFQHTFSGDWDQISFSHTFLYNQTGWRLDMGRVGVLDTATEFEVRNVWARRTKAGGGRWPMQNLHGYTYLTLPEHLSQRWGVGVEYNPDTGKARRFVKDGEYANAHPGEDLTGTSGFADTTNNGITSTVLSRYIDAQGRVVARIRHQGTLTAISAGIGTNNSSSRSPATPGQTWVSRLECRLISGTSPSEGVASGVHEETAPGTYLAGTGSNDAAQGGDVPITAAWTLRKTTRTLNNGATNQTRLGAVLRGAVSEVIDCVIEYREVQLAPGDFPYLPRIPGGQSTHAAQKIERAANEFMPLGANLYSAQGQSGAVGSSGSPWESDTGEGRFSVAENVLTLSAGSAEETVSLLGNVLGLANAKVTDYDLTIACTAGSILVKNAGGTTLYTVKAGETRTITDQVTVASGVAFSLYGGATAAGTITVNRVGQVQSDEATLFVDRTVGALGATQYAVVLHRDSTSSSERFLEIAQAVGNDLRVNTVIAGTGDPSVLDASIAIGDRQKLVVSRSASEMTGKAEGVTAPAANSVGAVADFATLRVGTNGWNGLDADAGDIHAIAVFSRVLTPTEQGELVDA